MKLKSKSFKESVPSVAISLLLLLTISLCKFSNPIEYFTNDYLVESYQFTSKLKEAEDIYIVNISDLEVEDIQMQINILSFYHPSVIGVDHFSTRPPLNDSSLVPFDNLVLPIVDENGSIRFSENALTTNASFGSVSIYSTSFFEPYVSIGTEKIPSFATQVIKLHDESRFFALQERNNEREIINYIGNITSFKYLGNLTESSNLSALKELEGKIVLLGYTGTQSVYPTTTDSYDSYDTPKGRMFGVVILANILNTVLGNYITPCSGLTTLILVVILTLVNILITNAIGKAGIHYLLIKVIQGVQIFTSFVVASFAIHRFGILVNYEMVTFAVILSPEIEFWFRRFDPNHLS